MISRRSCIAALLGRLVVISAFMLFSARSAMAIPSPELVISSVSSLSQIATVGVAMLFWRRRFDLA